MSFRLTVDAAESVRHSEYPTDKTASQDAIAAVVDEQPERAPREEGSGGGDVAQRLLPFLARASGVCEGSTLRWSPS